MNPNATADMLAGNGESIILRRMTGRGFYIEVQCAARVNDYQPQELQGGIIQGDRKVTLSNREIADRNWPGPPKFGDVVILKERGSVSATVRAASSNTLQGVVVRHSLQIRGS